MAHNAGHCRYAIESYRRALEGQELGVFDGEIVSVEGKNSTITLDEEPNSVNLSKLPELRPAFKKDGGTVTAGNASSINDGAAATILMNEEAAKEMNIKPLARIVAYADAEQSPVEFTTAPSIAVPRALDRAGMRLSDIDCFEINEAFSVVACANSMILGLDESKVNVFGGAVSLGHPIGMSGARIVGSLYSVLKKTDGKFGCATICNGGGGASAMIIERLE